MRISVRINRKAALLRGLELGDTSEMEVSPELCGDAWTWVVQCLDMNTTPPRLDPRMDGRDMPAFAAPEWADVRAVYDATRQAAADAVQKIADRHAQCLVECEASLSIFLSGEMIPAKLSHCVHGEHGGVLNYEGYVWSVPIPWFSQSPWYVCGDSEVVTRARQAVAAIQSSVDSANESARAAAMPAYIADSEAKHAEHAEKNAAEYRARLESGYWERETGTYNERRYCAPWCAVVDFRGGAKPNYTFGESTGKWGAAGLMRVRCTPGTIIAWGQKDLRRPANSEHNILIMSDDGSMRKVDKTEAFRAWQEAHSK